MEVHGRYIACIFTNDSNFLYLHPHLEKFPFAGFLLPLTMGGVNFKLKETVRNYFIAAYLRETGLSPRNWFISAKLP